MLVVSILGGIALPSNLSAQTVNGSAPPMPMMPGMNAGVSRGAASERLGGLERSFLLLIAVVAATGGVVVYGAVRCRYQRAGSTDALAMRARDTLKDLALGAAERRGVTFVENTGDGWFMTFPSVAGALETAKDLLRDLREHPPDLSPAPPLEARAAIAYGEILLDARGTRYGATINKAFRLVSLSAANVARVEGDAANPAVLDRNRILVDEEAAQELRAAETSRRFVGFCHLKGFSGLHGVYEMLWEER
jgi:hypothetical protein